MKVKHRIPMGHSKNSIKGETYRCKHVFQNKN